MQSPYGALALSLLALAARAQQGGVAPIQQQDDAYILNFSEDPASQLTLLDFVKLCQESTGFNFTYDSSTEGALKTAKVVMLGSKRIPKDGFYEFFQIQLFLNEFVCIEIGPPHIRVILIQSLQPNSRGQQTIKQKTVYVAPQDVEDYLDRPAVLITTVLNFKNIDARALQTSLRALVVDSNTQTMVPVGQHSLILQGFGSYIASLAKLLSLVDQVSESGGVTAPVFDLIPLEFAAAEDVADLLEQLLEAQQEQVRNRPRQAVEGQVAGLNSG
ncbi:MAG: hypothetical protein EXS08_16390, partial [Planctomycetes bacterium]|nr:hypothetical protein [Planctomycetota bacterium]